MEGVKFALEQVDQTKHILLSVLFF